MADIRTLISSKIRSELLRILALHPESSFNINELSRRSGFSIRGVDRELKNLLSGGILRRQISGNQHRYQLNPECPIYREIRGIITKTTGIAEVIKRALSSVKHEIELAFVYGSFASGDYGNDSDVDLFLVSELAGVKLAELIGPAQTEIGRSINISQFSPADYKLRREQKDHFVTGVLEGPKISIFERKDES
jgi:DNA-binding transcriptional ArsR family regulator